MRNISSNIDFAKTGINSTAFDEAYKDWFIYQDLVDMRERLRSGYLRLKDELTNLICNKNIVCIVGDIRAGKKKLAISMSQECFYKNIYEFDSKQMFATLTESS